MISLTHLTIIADETLALNEVRLHPDIALEFRSAVIRADVLRSRYPDNVRQFPHPFTSVGEDMS